MATMQPPTLGFGLLRMGISRSASFLSVGFLGGVFVDALDADASSAGIALKRCFGSILFLVNDDYSQAKLAASLVLPLPLYIAACG
jgi:hypothetical protein